jgi:hypothetical protein
MGTRAACNEFFIHELISPDVRCYQRGARGKRHQMSLRTPYPE